MKHDPTNRLPNSVGVGYKSKHFNDILTKPDGLDWLEIHAENYLGNGGRPIEQLHKLREIFPISVHGVGLSIGAEKALDMDHLHRVKNLCDWLDPVQFSEHLAWSTHDVGFLNDLLPLPYTDATLDRVVEHIDQVQTTLGRRILLENPANYLGFKSSTFDECYFLGEIVNRTGCGLLFDINNLFVSAQNMDWDAITYLNRFPLAAVGEIHLGGHHEDVDDAGNSILIDTHSALVAQPVWALYQRVIEAVGPLPTLIEWDTDVPDWAILYRDVRRAADIMDSERVTT